MWHEGIHCFSQWGQGVMGHGFMGQGVMGYGFLGVGLKLLFFIALIVLVYKAFRPGKTPPPENRDAKDSLMILDQRLAKGEITEEEYHRIRKILTGH